MIDQLISSASRNLVLPLILWRGGELNRLHSFREFSRTQYLSADEIASMQRERFEKIVEHAYLNCPFYQKRFREFGVIPDDATTYEMIPALSKSDIQIDCDQMVADNWPKDDLILDQTGGSTAEPISFYMNKERYESRVGAMWRHDQWAGLNVGDRTAYVWGAPRDTPSNSWKSKLRNRLLGGQLWLDTSNLTESLMRGFDAQLKRFRPKTIVAYANAIVLLAKYFQDNQISTYQPQSIITSAELLTDEGRKIVESVFGCPVFNRYGCREFSVIASECEEHDGLHIMSEGLLIEIDKTTQNKHGSSGELLVTDLLNFAMPMIRYRIGDQASFIDGDCRCGRGLPRLKSVDGRVTDFVVGSEGQLVSGVFLATYVVAQRPSLGRVQFLQEKVGQIQINTLPGANFDQVQDVKYLVESTKEFMGSKTEVEITIVEKLVQTRSGKIPFSISKALPEYAAVNE